MVESDQVRNGRISNLSNTKTTHEQKTIGILIISFKYRLLPRYAKGAQPIVPT